MARFSEQICYCKSGVFGPDQPKYLEITDEGHVGFRRRVKATYYGERKWLPLSHQTDFTLKVEFLHQQHNLNDNI